MVDGRGYRGWMGVVTLGGWVWLQRVDGNGYRGLVGEVTELIGRATED